jgi:hypothetical protein
MSATALQPLPTYIKAKIPNAIVPVKYTAAVKALAECRNIDDAKYFADKSDALAAWAKIYRHNEAAVEAKRLKLHAFRRMGDLALAIQPGYTGGGPGRGGVPGTGPVKLLQGLGLTRGQAQSATVLSRMPEKKFKKVIKSSSPKSPSSYLVQNIGMSDSWKRVNGGDSASMASMRRFCRKNDPRRLALNLTPSEAKRAKEMATEIIEWMDTFDQYLPENGK